MDTKKSLHSKYPSNIRDQALQSFQRLRRLEEASDDGYVRCISCGKIMHWKDAQGGHYIPRANKATELESDNVWPQCAKCNMFSQGNIIRYRYNLVKTIGEARVKRIENMAEAYKGNEEAMEELDDRDKMEVIRIKKKPYYMEKKHEFDDKIRKLKGLI